MGTRKYLRKRRINTLVKKENKKRLSKKGNKKRRKLNRKSRKNRHLKGGSINDVLNDKKELMLNAHAAQHTFWGSGFRVGDVIDILKFDELVGSLREQCDGRFNKEDEQNVIPIIVDAIMTRRILGQRDKPEIEKVIISIIMSSYKHYKETGCDTDDIRDVMPMVVEAFQPLLAKEPDALKFFDDSVPRDTTSSNYYYPFAVIPMDVCRDTEKTKKIYDIMMRLWKTRKNHGAVIAVGSVLSTECRREIRESTEIFESIITAIEPIVEEYQTCYFIPYTYAKIIDLKSITNLEKVKDNNRKKVKSLETIAIADETINLKKIINVAVTVYVMYLEQNKTEENIPATQHILIASTVAYLVADKIHRDKGIGQDSFSGIYNDAVKRARSEIRRERSEIRNAPLRPLPPASRLPPPRTYWPPARKKTPPSNSIEPILEAEPAPATAQTTELSYTVELPSETISTPATTRAAETHNNSKNGSHGIGSNSMKPVSEAAPATAQATELTKNPGIARKKIEF